MAIQPLEDRLVLATLSWIGPNDGLWSTPANWDLGRAPTDLDTLYFGAPFGANTNSVNNIPELTLSEIFCTPDFTGVITIAAVQLTVMEDFTSHGTVVITGGALNPTNVNVGSDFLIYGGLVTGGAVSWGTVAISAGWLILHYDTTWYLEPGTTTSVTASVLQAGALDFSSLEPTLNLTGFYHLENTGEIHLGDGTFNHVDSSEILLKGQVNMTYGLLSSNGPVDLEGTIFVNGISAVFADLNNQSGTVQLSNSSMFGVGGNYTQFLGTLDMDVTGSVSVSGTATLNGTLRVRGQVTEPSLFIIIGAGTGLNDFTTKYLPALQPPLTWIYAGWAGSEYVIEAD